MAICHANRNYFFIQRRNLRLYPYSVESLAIKSQLKSFGVYFDNQEVMKCDISVGNASWTKIFRNSILI